MPSNRQQYNKYRTIHVSSVITFSYLIRLKHTPMTSHLRARCKIKYFHNRAGLKLKSFNHETRTLSPVIHYEMLKCDIRIVNSNFNKYPFVFEYLQQSIFNYMNYTRLHYNYVFKINNYVTTAGYTLSSRSQ